MEFPDLQYFVSIADTGSFTKSAPQTNVAQSALSRRERDLGAELARRYRAAGGLGLLGRPDLT